MSEPNGPSADDDRLGDFGRRLDNLERRSEQSGLVRRKVEAEPNSALGSAFKLSTEFVAAVVVGGGLGWLLDRGLNTKPILLLIGLAFGVAAGFYGVFRSARGMQAADAVKAKSAPALPASDEEDD